MVNQILTLAYAYTFSWFEENPATTIAATAFGMTIVLFGLLAVYCYLKYRNDQAKLALENAEVETGRIAIGALIEGLLPAMHCLMAYVPTEEKQRAISSESGGTCSRLA